MRVCTALPLCLGLIAAMAGRVDAQPVDPYNPGPAPAPRQPVTAPAPPPAPAPLPAPGQVRTDDPVLAEQVALSLVHRAQELYDARVFVDAKQLAVEAMVRSPKGQAAEQARFLIQRINQQLGISDVPVPEPKPEPKPEPVPDLTPIEDPAEKHRKVPVGPTPERPDRPSRLTAGVHAGLYFGLLGATIGAFFDDDTPAGGAIPVGIVAGLGAGLYAPRIFDRLKWSDAQIRTMGSLSAWGGVVGGFFADSVKKQGSSARHVLVGSTIGATAGAVGGALIARKNRFTKGDIALVDTLSGIGAVGGLTVGMLMQPAETEAYSVNSIFGTVGGVLIGMVAAPQTNTTQRRMVRVAGASAIGGAIPFLLYAGIYDKDTKADERVTGFLSSAGLIAGAWIGFRLTRKMDVDGDVLPGKREVRDDAPIALIGRHSDGRWAPGALTVQPLSQALAPQRGMALPLLGATF